MSSEPDSKLDVAAIATVLSGTVSDADIQFTIETQKNSFASSHFPPKSRFTIFKHEFRLDRITKTVADLAAFNTKCQTAYDDVAVHLSQAAALHKKMRADLADIHKRLATIRKSLAHKFPLYADAASAAVTAHDAEIGFVDDEDYIG